MRTGQARRGPGACRAASRRGIAARRVVSDTRLTPVDGVSEGLPARPRSGAGGPVGVVAGPPRSKPGGLAGAGGRAAGAGRSAGVLVASPGTAPAADGPDGPGADRGGGRARGAGAVGVAGLVVTPRRRYRPGS